MLLRGASCVWMPVLFALAACDAVLGLEHVDYRESDAAVMDAADAARADATPDVTIDATADAPRRSTGDPTCDVRDDGKLHCTNRADAPLRAEPNSTAAIVNTLRTTKSYFECWGPGEPHAGGNSTWYYTLGEDTPAYGWLPGVMLNTPDEFDADPSAYGLRRCP